MHVILVTVHVIIAFAVNMERIHGMMDDRATKA